MLRVIYIAGAYKSGTTLLNLVLAENSRCVGLGEVAKTLGPGTLGLSKSRKQICTCGSAIDHCRFWSEVIKHHPAETLATLEGQYRAVLGTFHDVYPDRELVESSKYLDPLQILSRMPDVDLRVVHIIKDVRAYATSQVDRKQRGWLQRRPLYWFRKWHQENCSLQREIERLGIKSFRVGYEELCLRAEEVVGRLCGFLGLPFEPPMLAPCGTNSHIVRGNPRAGRYVVAESNKQKISYDCRWFHRRDWLLAATVCPRIMEYNRSMVYSNIRSSMTARHAA